MRSNADPSRAAHAERLAAIATGALNRAVLRRRKGRGWYEDNFPPPFLQPDVIELEDRILEFVERLDDERLAEPA